MLRKILKYSIFAHIALAIMLLLVLFIMGGAKISRIFPEFFLFPIPAIVVIALGLFIGLAISVLVRRPRLEQYFYLGGQALTLLAYAAFVSYAMFYHPSSKKSNAEENEATIRDLTNDNDRYFIHLAYNHLQTKLGNPNDLKINSLTTFERDTLIDSHRDSSFTVYFTYALEGVRDREYFSKYIVSRRGAQLIEFNADTKLSEEYRRISRMQESAKDALEKYEKMTD